MTQITSNKAQESINLWNQLFVEADQFNEAAYALLGKPICDVSCPYRPANTTEQLEPQKITTG